MKIYIAGAITDNPNYREQFRAAEERLTAQGHAVINPCKNEGFTYREYINMGLCELMHCDAIYLLKGYEESTGATLEHDYARTVGLEIIEEEEFNPEDVTIEIAYEAWLNTAKAANDVDQKLKGIVTGALKKQIPVEHHHTTVRYINDNVRVSVCPECLGVIHTSKIEYPNYCTWCGQKIHWEV